MITSLFSLPVLAGLLGLMVALPVAIHLINMLRHRRVQWAAMDFLLASYKKNRNWIWLKQLLLLLMRMAALILVLFMLAQVGCRNEKMAEFMGGKASHHYVLLDDSYSMSDRDGDTMAFDRARDAVELIARRAGTQKDQRFTLIRFSQAMGTASADDEELKIKQIADISGEEVDQKFDELLIEKRGSFEVTQLSVGPAPALDVLRQLVGKRDDEQAFVYVVSDFRNNEWENPTEINKSLEALESAGASIQMINCVKEAHDNLGIIDLSPENETRAAGVPLFLNVTVKNFGEQTARRIPVRFRSFFYDPLDELSGDPEPIQPNVDEGIPAVVIDSIRPGETVTSRVQVQFPKMGKHAVEAYLPEDAIAADNRRWSVVDFLEGVPILMIDGSEARNDSFYLNRAFEPGGKAKTGIRPDVQGTDFLRDAQPELLEKYHAIYLLDIDDLDGRAVENLETYVENGGGLGVFLGPNTNVNFFNEILYRGGEGLLPAPLSKAVPLPDEIGQDVPDVTESEHPIFLQFKQTSNTWVNLLLINQYFELATDWDEEADPNSQVIAKLRNNKPLAVERKFGEGRVVAFNTSIGAGWNNWAKNPTFIVVMLKTQAHLSIGKRVQVPRVVGNPIQLQLDAKKYVADLAFVVPGGDEPPRPTIDRQAKKVAGDSPLLNASIGESQPGEGHSDETNTAGTYEAWVYTTDNEPEVHRWAVNVGNSEGNLAISDNKTILTKLDDAEPSLIYWEDFDPNPAQQAGFSWSRMLMLILIFVLLFEQIVAYLVSYHPARGAAR